MQNKVWNIPPERSKNRRPHSIPLSPTAVEIIEGLPRFDGSDFLFSAGGAPPTAFSHAKRNLDADIARLNAGDPIAHFVLHDIRRSVASGMASIGVDLHVIERCLNHVSGSFGGIVAVYQKHSVRGRNARRPRSLGGGTSSASWRRGRGQDRRDEARG